MSAGRESGFTLLGLLLVVGVMGAGLAAYGQIYSHQAQREKVASEILPTEPAALTKLVRTRFWRPRYLPFVRSAR